MKRSWMSFAGLFLLAAAVSPASEATFLMRGEHLPVTTVANGWVQMVTPRAGGEVLVHVTTDPSPIGAHGLYGRRGARTSTVPDGFALPARLAADLRPDVTAWWAATRILEWVMGSLRLDEYDGGPQDARSVLRRGSGRCAGLANTAAALLLTAGFEARTISGLLVSREGVIPHRWLECRLPGAEWVPSDPTLGLWAVTPRHVAFADTVVRSPDIEILAISDGALGVLPQRFGRPMRPNVGSDLVCRLVGDGREIAALATLRGADGSTYRTLLDPEGEFTRVLPGRWLLEVELEGSVLERREILLRAGEVNSIAVSMPDPRGPAGPPPRGGDCEEVRDSVLEGRGRNPATSRIYGAADCSS